MEPRLARNESHALPVPLFLTKVPDVDARVIYDAVEKASEAFHALTGTVPHAGQEWHADEGQRRIA